jgi:hypothetical protein
MNTVTGPIPQSRALSEATVEDSFPELMSRDPEGYQAQDLARIVEALRAQRARWAEAEAAQSAKPKGARASPRVSSAAQQADELGL